MEVLDELGSSEQTLALRAAALHVPLGGTFELLPVCNMDCKMCYIRTTSEEMHKQGTLLTAEEWIKIAESAREQGMLYLLLTGGEPLLYPEFEKLYTWLGNSGIVTVLNTNGTLINDRIADLFLKFPPRKVNISLYGASDETYARLCNHPHGFTRVIEGINLLKKRQIPVKLNCSLTPFNIVDLEKMHMIAKELDVPLQVSTYMFPPIRKEGIHADFFSRFSPEEAARMIFRNAKLVLSEENYRLWTQERLQTYNENRNQPQKYSDCGLSCYASKNNFWVNWKGEMLPCGMMNRIRFDIRREGFSQCWDKIVAEGMKIINPDKCCQCEKRVLCTICSAASLAETGAFDKNPEYLCEMTDHIIHILKEEQV